ncbi:unnamed protein product [Acanthosepion pharaonis]|uniref:Uncharacterized protein n=1 Tax=Acanthosepion pharaonis TaxID=158019 RepID=A0A812ESE2_ACAPH|nr:unnamed protein product [Sepia pharaonis]
MHLLLLCISAVLLSASLFHSLYLSLCKPPLTLVPSLIKHLRPSLHFSLRLPPTPPTTTNSQCLRSVQFYHLVPLSHSLSFHPLKNSLVTLPCYEHSLPTVHITFSTLHSTFYLPLFFLQDTFISCIFSFSISLRSPLFAQLMFLYFSLFIPSFFITFLILFFFSTPLSLVTVSLLSLFTSCNIFSWYFSLSELTAYLSSYYFLSFMKLHYRNTRLLSYIYLPSR